MADELDFQDLPYEDTSGAKLSGSKQKEHTVEFTDFPPDATEDADEEDESQTQKESGDSKTSHSIFSLAFYQQFFDVDTFDVGNRILGSMVPNPKRNYLEHVIRPNPDLYGPFWVCATLTFCIGIAGNVADFFHRSGLDFVWKYDFHKVTLAATAIFSYWLIIPLVIWGILRWRGSIAGYTLTELICVYGYSLAIFIPCSILWLIPVVWVQILIAVICSALSGVTLLITLYPAVKNDTKQVMAIFLVIVIILHTLLATGFVLYFFKYNWTSSPVPKSNLQNSTQAAVQLKADGVPNNPPGSNSAVNQQPPDHKRDTIPPQTAVDEDKLKSQKPSPDQQDNTSLHSEDDKTQHKEDASKSTKEPQSRPLVPANQTGNAPDNIVTRATQKQGISSSDGVKPKSYKPAPMKSNHPAIPSTENNSQNDQSEP